ncbi:MAG: hypothetical protein ACOY9J_05620 [Pseudomonadota bacterium]
MLIVIVLLAFVAGLACGLALRPGIDRRLRLRRLLKSARARRTTVDPEEKIATQSEHVLPRDYYLAGKKERGSLAEGFGLKTAPAAATGTEPDVAKTPMPRDYYERDSPEDVGTLSESFGLKPRGENPA